jgi:hypothetical protein
MARIGDYGVVHAGLGFLNKKTINQIVERVRPRDITLENICEELKIAIEEELYSDDSIQDLEPGFLIVSLGIVGYNDDLPFVHRIIYLRSEDENELLEVIESEDTFNEDNPPYGIDYFGDYEFVQLVIRAAKERGLLKPFDILSVNDTLELARTLMRFLIDFQRFMVSFTVSYPIESAVITRERGFEWVDQIELKEFHYDDSHPD